jgi:hypothetical protein
MAHRVYYIPIVQLVLVGAAAVNKSPQVFGAIQVSQDNSPAIAMVTQTLDSFHAFTTHNPAVSTAGR